MEKCKSKEFNELLLQYEELIEIENNKLSDDELICECFLLSVSHLREFIKNNNRIENLPKWCFDNTCLGHGCGSCIKNKDDWKDRI